MNRHHVLSITAAGILAACLSLTAVAGYPDASMHAVFNGSGYISVPSNAAFNSQLTQTGAFSIDAWVFPTSFANFPTVVGNDYISGYWLGFNTQGKIRFYPGGGTYRESASSVPLNQWTHIAVSFDAFKSTIRFYINNVLDQTIGNVGVQIGTNQADLRIGADRSGSVAAYQFNGGIDEVRIWNTLVDFPTASGSLYRIPQSFGDGAYGRNLVAAWRLNGDAADSTGGFNGSAVGTVVYSASGNPPHYARICAVMMNDNLQNHDYFAVPSSPSISLTTAFTLECWVYLPSSGGVATAYQTFMSKGSIANNALSYWLGCNMQNRRLRFMPDGVWAQAMESTDPLPANQWTHVAATFSSSGGTGAARLYINGVQKGSTTYKSQASANAYPLLIGTGDQQLSPVLAYALYGRIDEIRIWNTARTPQEIADAFAFEIDAASGLVASYHLNGDLLDASNTGNTGTNHTSSAQQLYFRDATDLPAIPTLTLTVPAGGESWAVGTTQKIMWTSTGLTTVSLYLSRDGGATYPETLASGVSATAGSYAWLVTGPDTKDARVRVATPTPTPGHSESGKDFTIFTPPPTLTVTPLKLSFTVAKAAPSPPDQIIRVRNTGGGTLTWSASWSASWLSLSPTTDSGNDDTITVHIAQTWLPPGTYTDNVTIDGNQSNPAQIVSVTLTVLPSPHVDPRPTALHFATSPGVSPPAERLAVLNDSGGTLTWSARTSDSWITVSPDHGIQGDSITVSVSTASFPIGTYSGSVIIDGNATNVPLAIPVEVTISNEGYYAVGGTVLSSGIGLAGITIGISGDTSLTVTTAEDGGFSAGTLRRGSYVVTPVNPYFTFTPPSITISPLTAPRTDLAFTATRKSGSGVLHYTEGWNLISLPVDPSNPGIDALLPDAVQPRKAYRYSQSQGYVETTQLVFGVGYWVRFAKSDSVVIQGTLRGALTLTLAASPDGWNMVGMTSGPVPIGSIVQSPPGALLTMYQYDPGIGYRLPPGDMMQPGRGYFVKVTTDATFNLASSRFQRSEGSDPTVHLPSSLPDILHLPPPPGNTR